MTQLEREAKYFYHTYRRIPLEIDRGEGVYLYAKDGKRYLDMFAGLGVNALGYGHPKVLQAIAEQSRKYLHLSNLYLQEPQIALAELLSRYSGYEKVFFCNSGTEGMEGALKIARRWGSKRGKSDVISFSNAFHGRTMGALSMMDRHKYRDGYEPFLQHCTIVPFNNVDALLPTVDERTLAIVLEFIQGEAGIHPVIQEFVDEIRRLKERFGFLLVADEIQSGLGRAGKLFAFQHFDIVPDIVVVAKPLGGGLPLGAILGNATAADVLAPGQHGSTFGGNPVACAAGSVVLREVVEGGAMQNASAVGQFFKDRLCKLKDEFPVLVKDVRGYGLMLGVELTRECGDVVRRMREKRVLINCTSENVLRFLPPLVIAREHVEETIVKLRASLREQFQT